MEWKNFGRATMATVLSLGLGVGITACSRDYTVAYLYVTASTRGTTGVINAYQVDYQSGALVQLPDSPIQTSNKNPVTVVAAPNGKTVYVVFRDDSVVTSYAVGTDGKLYGQKTTNVVGSFPTAAAVDPAGNYLYVTSTYNSGSSTASPGPGVLTTFKLNADGTLGAASAVSLGNSPVGVVASAFNNFVYVVDRETVTSSSGASGSAGVVLAFKNNGSGVLTPVTTGTTLLNGYPAGVVPSSIAEDPTARFVYVTDQVSNQLIGYIVQSGGALTAMTNGPFATGQFPVNVIVDPRGLYLYVTNFNSGTIGAYALDTATGTPTGSVGSTSTAVDTNPTCATIEPALGIYLYTSNNAAGTVSGLQLDPHNGSLKQIQNTPFPASALPTCAAAIANGSHATQVVQP